MRIQSSGVGVSSVSKLSWCLGLVLLMLEILHDLNVPRYPTVIPKAEGNTLNPKL